METGWSDGGHGRLRASHDDRREVLALLRAAERDGRLGGTEFDRRIRAVDDAETRADLVSLTTDLPARPRAREWVAGWRIRAKDRERAATWLAAGNTGGRLTPEEYQQRLSVLPSVVDYGQLTRLLAGVPGWPGAADADLLPSDADRDVASAALAEAVADGRVDPVEQPLLAATIRHARRAAELAEFVTELAQRASDGERAQVLGRLDEAYRAGQLDLDEHRDRRARAAKASADAELDTIAADLGPASPRTPVTRWSTKDNQERAVDHPPSVARRLTDDDRRRTVDQLRRALDDGRLDLARYEERVRASVAATTEAQLAPLLADLAAPPRPPHRGPLDVFYDFWAVNSALLPRPRGWRQRLTSKTAWKAMVTAIALGILAWGIAAITRGGQANVVYVVLAPWVVVVTGGVATYVCARPWQDQVAERTKAICGDLATRLSTMTGVREAEVEHESRITVTLRVDDGTETGPLVEETVCLLWQSRLYPLRIHVYFRLPTGYDSVFPKIGPQKDALRHRYGRRPYGPIPSREGVEAVSAGVAVDSGGSSVPD